MSSGLHSKVDSMESGITEYDDTVVRQMIECIRIHSDGKLEVIFGGGISVEEHI